MRLQFLVLAFWLSFSGGVFGTEERSLFSKCLSTLYKLQNPAVDTAIELEMATDPAVLSLFTTRNGVLGDFFEERNIPEGLKRKFSAHSDSEIRQIPWRQLTAAQRMAVLGAVSQEKRTPFFEDRKIPHLKYADSVTLFAERTAPFLGKDLARGRHEVRTDNFLKGSIEYIGPNNDPSGVELHFRTNLPAGEVSRSARSFQEMLQTDVTHQHAYVVAPIPQEALEQSPALVAFRNADFFRRANLAAEMITIVEEGGSITKRESFNRGDLVRWFGWLDRYDLKSVYRYLLARGEKKDLLLGDQVKIAWVGFRGHDKFDQPDLMGMEVRSIGRGSPMEVVEPFLNTLQKSWTEQELGLSAEKMGEWLEKEYQNNALAALDATWYHKEWSEILRKAPPSIKQVINDWGPEQRSLFLESAPEETKMLFHDWGQDPIYFGSTTRKHLLAREQAMAFENLRRGGIPYREVVKSFLVKSGLYERVLRSLKPQVVDPNP